jgi:hypothetical protein
LPGESEKKNINIWRCSPKYADLYKSKIEVKASEIESLAMIKQIL